MSQLETVNVEWTLPPDDSLYRVHAFTTVRRGGVSLGNWAGGAPNLGGLNLGLNCGDRIADVQSNRALLRQSLPSEPHWLAQVHGTEVVEVDDGRSEPGPTADGALTLRPGVVISVLTADCMPVFFRSLEGDAIGICHAGWRGLASGVIESTLDRLRARRPNAREWLAHLGPCIGPTHFEVGLDVVDAFCSDDPDGFEHFMPREASGKYLADLYGLASRRLQRAGLNSISAGTYCTFRDRELFYSYRRDRLCGRMASLMWMEAKR